MQTIVESNSVWHNDGHVIHLELNRSNVVITHIECPASEECRHEHYGCMVTWFLEQFGLECNVGIGPAASEIQIAWMLSGDSHDLEAAQIWVIPVNDEAFAAWLITQQ